MLNGIMNFINSYKQYKQTNMQRLVFFISMIVLTSAFTMVVKKQEKQATLILSRGEMEAVYQIIDDAAVPGAVRRPLLDKLMKSYQAAFQQPAPVKDTTTKPKKQ